MDFHNGELSFVRSNRIVLIWSGRTNQYRRQIIYSFLVASASSFASLKKRAETGRKMCVVILRNRNMYRVKKIGHLIYKMTATFSKYNFIKNDTLIGQSVVLINVFNTT